jgi:hypothetical protein
VPGGGRHESEPVRIAARGRAPRLLLSLVAPRRGTPVHLHLIVVGDLIINDVLIDLDSAHLAAVTLTKLVRTASGIDPDE